MPEYRVVVRWPDGQTDHIYSPSSVVQTFFRAGDRISLADFQARGSEALIAASMRVEARYGHPCSRAMSELRRLEARTKLFGFEANTSKSVDILSVVEWESSYDE
ncbi:MAG: MSMEG_0570 family nitrogen starvation response protein [Myxococcales bacterium]|nr:MSMEG_0570 family nitrogen starvation response protein [Myxococcales bacterium]